MVGLICPGREAADDRVERERGLDLEDLARRAPHDEPLSLAAGHPFGNKLGQPCGIGHVLRRHNAGGLVNDSSEDVAEGGESVFVGDRRRAVAKFNDVERAIRETLVLSVCQSRRDITHPRTRRAVAGVEFPGDDDPCLGPCGRGRQRGHRRRVGDPPAVAGEEGGPPIIEFGKPEFTVDLGAGKAAAPRNGADLAGFDRPVAAGNALLIASGQFIEPSVAHTPPAFLSSRFDSRSSS